MTINGKQAKGLKSAAGESKELNRGNNEYLQIGYNAKTGEVVTHYHISIGMNSWSEYNDKDVIRIGNIDEPKTMKQICEMIENALAYLNSCRY